MNITRPFPATALFVFLVIISNLQVLVSKPSGFQLKLIPRDSPDSPLYPGNLTHTQKLQRLVKFTQAKSNYVNFLSTSVNATLDQPNNIFLPLIRDVMYYVAEVSIGTPPKTQWLMVDTGSGLIWTQCTPCKTCFHQNYPIYEPSSSRTYKTFPPTDPFCKGADKRFKVVNNKCVYAVSYHSGEAVTRGVLSRESFVFKDFKVRTGLPMTITFGCSNNNKGFAFEDRGVITGIMGLNLKPVLSLVSQLSNQIQGRFSYCMAPFSDGIQSSLYLRFGEDIPKSRIARTTPFENHVNLYQLTLNGISVGSNRLKLPQDAFRRKPGGSNGFFIDSGCSTTVIDEHPVAGVNAFAEVINAFQIHYNSKGLIRLSQPKLPLDYEEFELCYKNKPNFNSHPTMTYHFEGADYVVDSKYVTINFEELNVFCVTITPGHQVSILGAYHQQNMRIIHDVNRNVLQFYSENCAKDHTP